ncbi:Hypothetical_protein [Hexamita inflata]|uniref:Hypothetical_protein n=1 Tax=Hexamita inflata TaxID=28002 RepID=A0AA86VKJ2_9EUKA|nr:Hypothetical protein HINF_LOCUS56928 [Hexamita inflata]
METEYIKESTIITTINNDNNFALFGFNNNLQQIQQSVINITVGFNLYNGALICFQCDVSISNSITIFIASGQFLSGLIFNSVQTIHLQNTSIQYRFESANSAGLIFNVSQQISSFDLSSVNILGYNTININQAHFVLILKQQLNINISQVKICQETIMLASESQLINFSTLVQEECKSICAQNLFFVYGICADQPISSDYVITNETFVCIQNAIFDGNQCICKEDHVLNGSVCVNVLQSLTNIYKRIESLSTVEADMNTVFQLINNLNQSVETELTQLQQDMITQYNTFESHLFNNVSTLQTKQNNNNNELDQRIFNNISQLQQELLNCNLNLQQQVNSSTQSLSNAISNTNNLLNLSTTTLNQSVSDLNKTLIQNISQTSNNIQNVQNILSNNIISNFTTLDQRLASNITQKDLQIQQLTDSLTFVTSIVMNTVEQEFWFECQQQLYTFKVFDLATATTIIQSSDFASGFAFDTQVIQNAFLDVQSISSSFTLFQTQSAFLKIKVQLNDINFVSGAMLSPSSTIQINQLAVVSKTGTQVTINAGVVLSILQQTATVTNITNLLLNINMNPSSAGIISLINVVNGKLIVKGYQILGSYSSTKTITFGVCQIQGNSTVKLNYIQISPDQFTCGNLSSFLISYVNSSTIQINHISIIIGNSTQNNQISLLISTQISYFTFGGLVTYQNTTNINIQDISIYTQIEWSTQFVYYSGYILGYSNCSNSTLYRICEHDTITTNINSLFVMFGLIGYYNGILQVYQITVKQNYLNGKFNKTGVIGCSNGTSTNLLNINIQLKISQNVGDRVGALGCSFDSLNNTLFDITIYNSELSAEYLGGLVAAQIRGCSITKVSVYSSIIKTSSILSDSYVGGVFALTYGQVQIQQCNVFDLQLFAKSDNSWSLAGGVIGDLYATQMTLNQTNVKETNVVASGSAFQVSSGGLLSWLFDKSVDISDSQVINTNISAYSTKNIAYSGGIMGYITRQPATISNSVVKSIFLRITGGTLHSGLIQGLGQATIFTAIGVFTDGINYINGVVITNCANVLNQSQNGC